MKRLLFIYACVSSLTGCASTDQYRIQESFDRAMGEPKEYFVRWLGIPTKCAPIGAGEFCEWYKDRGVQGGSYSTPLYNLYNGQYMGSVSNSDAHASYELATIEFNEGRAVSWKYNSR